MSPIQTKFAVGLWVQGFEGLPQEPSVAQGSHQVRQSPRLPSWQPPTSLPQRHREKCKEQERQLSHVQSVGLICRIPFQGLLS